MAGIADSSYKGYIWLVDNPAVVESLSEALMDYGVTQDNISIGNDARSFIDSLKPGDTVVVNSLFDLSPALSELIVALREASGKEVQVVSLRENGAIISRNPADILNILGNYAELSRRPSRPALVASEVSNKKYQNALKFYESGMSMQKATKAAGCNYSSFWYWYNKTIKHI